MHIPHNELEEFKKQHDHDGICDFCGDNEISGFWSGDRAKIGCCSTCATNYLPQFMADSVGIPLDARHVDSKFDFITQRYWKALAFRLHKHGKA